MAERGKARFPFLPRSRGKKAHWGLLPLCAGVDACRNCSKLALQAGKQNVKISSIPGVWTKELGGAASLKHLFLSPSAPLLADRKEYKSLPWKRFGGAVSELKDWLVLLFNGRQRCPSQAATQQVTHMGGIIFLTAQDFLHRIWASCASYRVGVESRHPCSCVVAPLCSAELATSNAKLMGTEPAFSLRSSSSAGPASMDFALINTCL